MSRIQTKESYYPSFLKLTPKATSRSHGPTVPYRPSLSIRQCWLWASWSSSASLGNRCSPHQGTLHSPSWLPSKVVPDKVEGVWKGQCPSGGIQGQTGRLWGQPPVPTPGGVKMGILNARIRNKKWKDSVNFEGQKISQKILQNIVLLVFNSRFKVWISREVISVAAECNANVNLDHVKAKK